MALAVSGVPNVASAGVISFVSELFSNNAAASLIEERRMNSQNMALLQAALNPNPNPSKGGGDITIVGGNALLSETGPSGTLADIDGDSNKTNKISIYMVRKGDSLSQIAKMFGVSVNTIMWANDLGRGEVIREGQTLVILPISGIRHAVTKGETLASIAKKYKGDLDEILDFNGLSEGDSLAVGEIVIIPDGEISTPVPSGSSRVLSSGGPRYEGYYMMPVLGARKTQGLHGYNGIDLAAPYGTPIMAAASGTIIINRDYGWNGGYGNYVVVRHGNGTQTLYAHNSRNIVWAGQEVVRGQVIGYVGSTGRSTGSHLHFEVRGAANPF